MDALATISLLRRAIAKLPPRPREVFWMSTVEGRSLDEIAAEFHIMPATARRHYQHAVNDLQILLAEDERLGTKPVNLSDEEASLLAEINEPPPTPLLSRYDVLAERRQAAVLSEQEKDEYQGLCDKLEAFQVSRLERVAELARLRGKSLTELMRDLGIRPRDREAT